MAENGDMAVVGGYAALLFGVIGMFGSLDLYKKGAMDRSNATMTQSFLLLILSAVLFYA